MTATLLRTVVMASVLVSTASGPRPDAQVGPAATPEASGTRLFRTHCATCHGADARGGGPLAERLRHAPPDLTRYTERNDGMFPSERVLRIIDGRDVRSHGDRDMPVWGDAFRSEPDGLTADEAKARIDAIVEHLRAIQRRDAD